MSVSKPPAAEAAASERTRGTSERAKLRRAEAENAALQREVVELRERLGQMERLADLDALAPIANRRAFVRELGRIIAFTQRYKARSSLIFFDINGFKRINDDYGHAVGDQALLHVANALLRSVRESDIVGRLGGDEFGVILVLTDAKLAAEKAAQLAAAVEGRPFAWDGRSHRLTVSYGVATFAGGETVSETLAAADRAMYRHKARQKRARRE